jgi:hypothetical protein
MTGDVITQARSALAKSPIYALRELHVQRDGNFLVLSGRVESFYHKQLAQEIIRLIATDLHVVNSIDVNYDETSE